MAATAGLPAPRRTRDFRLTDADAARLRQTRWRRLLGRFGDPRLAFTRPLATGLVTLGIAGLVLASAPSFAALGGIGSAGAAPAFAPVPGAPEGASASGQPRTDQGLPGSGSAALPGPGAVSGPTAGPVGSPSPQVPIGRRCGGTVEHSGVPEPGRGHERCRRWCRVLRTTASPQNRPRALPLQPAGRRCCSSVRSRSSSWESPCSCCAGPLAGRPDGRPNRPACRVH